jgi:hypothetical protein
MFLHADELKKVKTARGGPSTARWRQGKYAPLALTPGKTGRLPASDGGPVSFVVERPLNLRNAQILRHFGIQHFRQRRILLQTTQ